MQSSRVGQTTRACGKHVLPSEDAQGKPECSSFTVTCLCQTHQILCATNSTGMAFSCIGVGMCTPKLLQPSTGFR